MSDEKSFREKLQGRWMHSHEEDTQTEMVFRPASYRFPLSRGRAGFELKPDHTCTEIDIAPADGRLECAGTWHIDESGDIVRVRLDSGKGTSRVLEIVSLKEGRLVVKR